MKREGEEDLLCSDAVVGRIFKANAAPVGSPWMWTLAFGHHEDLTHGYAATREAAMAAFCQELAGGIERRALFATDVRKANDGVLKDALFRCVIVSVPAF